jgi:predicted negative regulator of RcsB-dependent stress response
MLKHSWLAALAVSLALCSSASAVDTVKKVSGGTINGTLKSIGKTEVSIEKTGSSTAETVPVNDVEVIFFEGEPPQLKLVRSSVANGAYANALTTLEKIDASNVRRPEITQDMQYYKALSQARLALGGGANAADAGKAMLSFVTANPNNYHILAANEVLGDLLVALGKYDAAQTYYSALEQSPFPDYKMRAGVATGRALAAQGKFADALKSFDGVLALADSNKSTVATQQRFAATLGKAMCLANENKPDEGIKLVEEVITGLGAEDTALQAQAYVTLGNCYLKKPDSKKQALLAFLHVDVLFFSQPQAHAEALKQLAVLWNDLGKPERALQATQLLKERYAGGASAAR